MWLQSKYFVRHVGVRAFKLLNRYEFYSIQPPMHLSDGKYGLNKFNFFRRNGMISCQVNLK